MVREGELSRTKKSVGGVKCFVPVGINRFEKIHVLYVAMAENHIAMAENHVITRESP